MENLFFNLNRLIKTIIALLIFPFLMYCDQKGYTPWFYRWVSGGTWEYGHYPEYQESNWTKTSKIISPPAPGTFELRYDSWILEKVEYHSPLLYIPERIVIVWAILYLFFLVGSIIYGIPYMIYKKFF